MESDEKLKVGIGTKEPEKLKEADVTILGVDVSKPKDKEGKVIKDKHGKELSEKVTFSCKHPDSEDPIELSKARYLKGDKVSEAGLWFTQDEDGLIPKNSALAAVLRYYNSSTISDMAGKSLQTVKGNEDYLCIKAY